MSRDTVGISIEVDRSRCVLCGGPNECAMASNPTDDAPCWCVGQVFPQELTQKASEVDDGASCICRSCLENSA